MNGQTNCLGRPATPADVGFSDSDSIKFGFNGKMISYRGKFAGEKHTKVCCTIMYLTLRRYRRRHLIAVLGHLTT